MQLADSTARTATTLRRNAGPDRRRHRRVAWRTRVRGLTSDGVEFEATTIDVCAGGIRINLARDLNVGEALVLYLDDIGRVEGVVTRHLHEIGYAIEFRIPSRKRDKIADMLTWLINRERLGLSEEREAERRIGTGQTLAIFGNGVTIACAVVDMSIFGVALKTAGPRPMIGDKVAVNGRTGFCIRYIDGGFAVDFRTVTD